MHTSAAATAQSVKGRFTAGHNVLRTRSPGTYFKMEQRNGVSYQTGIDSLQNVSRTEPMEFVVGSGRRGQSYLYWRNGLLFELPVSYLTGPGMWINSPGYQDGMIDFGRIIVPRCLECHSTFFGYERDPRAVRYARNYRLGIRCEKCHGDGRRHVQHHVAEPGDTVGRFIFNPAQAPRARKVDGCALCHSGPRELRRPPFTYRPGDDLALYLDPPADSGQPAPDVHGNQVGLLERSKCFRSSPEMSCSTCHDVHQTQRDVAAFVPKCLGCHDTAQHPMAARIGDRLIPDCIDCHMPNRKSNAIQINTATRQVALYFRSHAIGIYPEVAAAILGSRAGSDSR
ncbi:MAG TPA: multiheme c-type cytochrome [Gemmatimonadales bacterium]|nr:multiheme c-type cytochrome [Gemmatimonadales bacterium]